MISRIRYELAKNQTSSPTKLRTINTFMQRSLYKANTESSFKIPSFVLAPSSAAETPTNQASGGGGLPGPGISSYGLAGEHFEYPFSELLVWAVLTKRKEMAKLMWQHGERET